MMTPESSEYALPDNRRSVQGNLVPVANNNALLILLALALAYYLMRKRKERS